MLARAASCEPYYCMAGRTYRSPAVCQLINTAGDLMLLPRVLDAASRFERRPPDAEMEAMLGETRMISLFGLPA